MTPFVVVGMPRTGSTLLSTGLDQHPDVQCFGELFHPVFTERSVAHAIRSRGECIYFDPNRHDALEFLENWVFGRTDEKFQAVGFKLFGEYVTGPGAEKLFLRLRERSPSISFIHIVRENYLDVLVSREVARATRQWVVFAHTNEQPKIPDTIEIDPELAVRFFDNMRKMDRFYSQFFSGRRYHKVTYTGLNEAYQEEMNNAYRFLGLSDHAALARTVKQRNKSAREVVVNYEQLAKVFQNTDHAHLFM